MIINKQDTNGVKGVLSKGELGYDDYTTGGDAGRVYVGNGVTNTALAKKSEVDLKVTKVTSTDNAIVRFNGTTGELQDSKVVVDDIGNLAINQTIASAISGSWMKHIQIGANSFVINNSYTTTYITHNAVHNGSNWVYITNGPATLIDLSSGERLEYVAVSGVAGEVITLILVSTARSTGIEVKQIVSANKFLNTEASSTIVIDGSPVLNTDTKGYLIKGTSTSPNSDLQYDKPAMYIEVNSSTNTTSNSNWGNAKKSGGLFVEAKSWSGFNGELNAAYFRTYTSQYSAGMENALVGMSAIAQTNTGAGNNSADVWGANIIASQTSGNAPQDIVGIEVDILHTSPSTASTNYTGVWAQADGSGQYSNSAFLATRSAQSAGWRHVLKANVECVDSSIEVKNGLNSAGADGMNIGITYGAENTNIINAYVGTDATPSFKVTGDGSYPVWIKINGVLKKVMEGPPNSGGTGYKQLIVVN